MQRLCPTCHRRFEGAGFCPFDGTSLIPSVPSGGIAGARTLVSEPLPAQSPGAAPDQETLSDPLLGDTIDVPAAPVPAARPAGPPARPDAPGDPAAPDAATQAEVRRRTFPLTPSPVAAASTGQITQTRARSGPEPAVPSRVRAPSDPPRIKVRSASGDPSDALELLHGSADHDYDKLVGQTLDGRYYVENKIGEGGMGVVFAARHAVIERPLAIKVLKREAMRDTATIRRFVQEAKAASRIGHPNIVDVTDFGTTPDGMTYSVMEFVPGQTLGTAIRLGAPFPPARAQRIAAQIARALAAAHDKGIVHRDLKPENVFLLDRDGRPDFVKIVDFGIAKVKPPPGKTNEPRLTRAGSVFGTPEYMAPEQAAGRSDTDGRVDIYALGVIFYEMICGRVPHRGDSMVRTLAMQMLDPIEPPSRVRPDLAIAPELEAIVMRALAKKREQRYQTMGELLEALDAILPPAVAHSVTGSPVYTLAPLPPGADPGVVPSVPAVPLSSASNAAQPATYPGVEPARPATPAPAVPVSGARRVKDEPEFTAGDPPRSFQHVFTDELAPSRERRWPRILLFAMIAGGAVGAFALVLRASRAVVVDGARDASVIVLAADAGPPEPPLVPQDAAPVDADLVVIPEIDAGPHRVAISRRRDAGVVAIPDTPNHRGTILVQVLTRPEGAYLYEGYHYRGPGGAELEEPRGARLVITCRQTGYKPGTVEVNFDGNTSVALCVCERIKQCVDGLKNPFDDCEPR